MRIFSYHIVALPFFYALKVLLFPLKPDKNLGLLYVETMSMMNLGSPIYAWSRIFNNKIIVFAQWENECCLEDFLSGSKLGKRIDKGWHIRLQFLRKWGKLSALTVPEASSPDTDGPVVAITLARMRYNEIPRFIRWGRPVEKLVRDHPASPFALASIRYPNTVSTFSIWKTQQDMSAMVYGHSKVAKPARHIDAMNERERRDFHFEFTTLRFRPIAEYGHWNGQNSFIPTKETSE